MARTPAKTSSKSTKPAAKPATAKKEVAKPVIKAEPDKKVKPATKDDVLKAVVKAAAARSSSGTKVAVRAPAAREHDGDDGDDGDDDFAMPPKAAKAGAKPGKPGKDGKRPPIDLDAIEDDVAGAPILEDEEDEVGERGTPKRSLASEADIAAMEAENQPAKAKRGRGGNTSGGGDGNTARDKLIELGKQKGFVTYDEVNDHMPEDVVSTDQIDGWLSALGEHGIEVVDGANGRRPDLVDQPKGLDIEKEKEEGEVDEDEEYAYSRTSDPVRMYLRKMGSVSLLTREGEVEIAKRIEDGERKMLQAVLNSSVVVEELLEIGERLRKGKVRVKDVVKDIDEDEAEFNEQFYVVRVSQIIDKVRKLQRETEKLEEKILDDAGAGEGK